jgi:large subunit ribosomal protein L5
MKLKDKYQKEIIPELLKELKLTSVMAVPRLVKISVNVGAGEAISNSKVLEAISSQIATIVGQKPSIRKAKVSIATFKLRQGEPIGVAVTLRGQRMYDFLERLITIVLPRVRDFQGIPVDSFDNEGNYTLGLREQIVFHEIEYDKIDRLRGLSITIVTSAKNKEEGHLLLKKLGMPFTK